MTKPIIPRIGRRKPSLDTKCNRRHRGQRLFSTMIRALIAALALTLAVFAQPDVVIRSTTRLVEVHVVVQDSEGRPVAGLGKDDFRILDDGKERPLALFVPDAEAETVSAAPAGRTAGAAALKGAYSVILLDWLNAGPADRLRADDALRAILKSFQPRQKIALYVLGLEPPNTKHPLRLIRNFTGESAELGKIMEDPLALPNPELIDPPSRFDARYGSARTMQSKEEELYDWNNRILDTVHALNELADHMTPLRGRKSLIWISTGFPMQIDGNVVRGARPGEVLYLNEVNRALERFNRADIPVHTVDSRGLAVSGRSFGGTLHEFSERTGGVFFSGRNDLDEGMRQAFQDMYAGYTLGFLVPENAAPGMHAIQVRTSRPRVLLRYRESYQAGF